MFKQFVAGIFCKVLNFFFKTGLLILMFPQKYSGGHLMVF
jgi:hypothetical protein